MSDTPETEFKLRASRPLEVAAVDAVLRELGVPVRASRSVVHTDVYLDDSRGTLRAAGIGLRLRSTSDRHELATKTRARANAGLFVRDEHQAAWSTPAPPRTAQELPAPLRDRVEPFVLDRPLDTILQLATQRDVRSLMQDERDLGELTIDRVQASASGRTASFHEVEIEVAEDVAAVEHLARSLLDRLPLQAAENDKPSHAAQQLGIAPAATAAGDLDGDSAIGDAVGLLVARHLDAMRHAEVAVRTTTDTEALHALRVAVRRLRSIVRSFRDLWPEDAANRALDGLADTGRALGAVRDYDVLLADLGKRCTRLAAPLHAPAQTVVQWVTEQRNAADEQMQRWLRSDARLRLQTELEQQLGNLDRDGRSAAARTGDDVPLRISHAASRLRKLCGAIAPELPIEPVHELRIATKRLRYVAEEFAPLPAFALDKSLARLTALQQALGAVCDHEFAAARLLTWMQAAAATCSDRLLGAAAIGGLVAQLSLAAGKARKVARRELGRTDRKRVWRRFASELSPPDANVAS